MSKLNEIVREFEDLLKTGADVLKSAKSFFERCEEGMDTLFGSKKEDSDDGTGNPDSGD